MSDLTKDWSDPVSPKTARKASPEAGPAIDTRGSDVGSMAAATSQPKSFGQSDSPRAPTPSELAADADALLRKSLETVRTQAEDLKRQSTEWAALRSDQARELIDERPLTVVAAAFGMGLILGALVSR